MSHGKQFTLYSNRHGPNGWKVATILEELGLSYETKFLDFKKGEHLSKEHIAYNPNGRIPTLIDHHNNDFVIWESDAILLYLVDRYDPQYSISVSDPKDKYIQLQWLFFQASGQGPYYGQVGWFVYFHPEKVPSAIARYKNEAKRVLGVLNSVLEKQPWLVGEKLTVADLSFIVWNDMLLTRAMPGETDLDKDFPAVAAWHRQMGERPSVRKVRTDWDAARVAIGQVPLQAESVSSRPST